MERPMEQAQIESLIECLVANPHDAAALARAHRQGESDPQGYAYLLEQVGTRTEDPSYASHWLSEAANIWSVTLGDAHKAARVLMIAVDRDPTQPLAADRLAQLYRDKGDVKALVAMLDRRVRLLTPMLAQDPATSAPIRPLLATLHEELGKLWNEAPLAQPRKAIDHYKRSVELDPTGAFAIFSMREIFKSLQQWDDALSLYPMELSVEQDGQRRLMLYRDESATRRLAGDLAGATRALRTALDELRSRGDDDPILAQEVAGSILDRAEARTPLDERERAYGADLLAGLAESFDGEHGLAYSGGALDLVHGHDRAMQLHAHYWAATGSQGDSLSLRYHAYLQENPHGPMAETGRIHLSSSYEAIGQLTQALQVLAPLRGRPEIDQRMSALENRGARPSAPQAMSTPAFGVEEMATIAGSPAVDPSDTEEVLEASHGAAPDRKKVALEAARAAVTKSDKGVALDRYLDVLAVDPLDPEALSWVEDALRTKRDYAKLRDVLWASARAMGGSDSVESRKLRLREIAGLSESNLKDLDGAIQAWRQMLTLDRGDDGARQSLTRALEKTQRWDDLANLYEQEAITSADTDAKVQLEKKLATLHADKRNDPQAAAEAWSRIAGLAPDDPHALITAADLFEKAARPDLAAAFLGEHEAGIADVAVRADLLERLGRLLGREGAEDRAASARAYKRAAEVDPTSLKATERWASAERLFAEAKSWSDATAAAERLAELAPDGDVASRSDALARASRYQQDGGDEAAATRTLERAVALAPDVDRHAVALLDRYRASSAFDKLAPFLAARGASHPDPATRLAALREAANLYEAPPLKDEDAARAQWQKVLEAGDDAEALDHLIQFAETRGELDLAAALLRRLGALATTKDDQTRFALREAELLSKNEKTVDAALERYEWVVSLKSPATSGALRAIADLELARNDPKAAAKALERELPLTEAPAARRDIATRLVKAYEKAGDDTGTFGALRAMREADAEDFDALNRMVTLAEKLERWGDLVDLLAQQIEVEADENEISVLTQRRAALLADKLERGDDALAALQELADAGDDAGRDAYVALGDRLGWRGIVATKLVEWWFGAPGSESRTEALTGAFERFSAVGRDADAVRVGVEILRASRDTKLAQAIEELAAKTSNEAGVTAAQEVLGVDLNGLARATELVRQAETRARAGMAWSESVQHGETTLGALSHEETGPLLERLAALAPTASAAIDLYERQVSRSRGGEAKEKALTRAAQVAATRGDLKRARTFFDLALGGTPSDATLDALEQAVGDDEAKDGLRRVLAEALSKGGEGVRDGGRSRANFLRRAAQIAHAGLHDDTQAFTWLSDALVAHAELTTLDALSALAEETKSPRRVDEVLTHVLTEVFDGPLVRLVLARRAKVRKELLDDRVGAAADLKKLHDLSPTDEAVMTELATLLTEQGDHRSMIQLYEDQILRSKDQTVRADLARKVAQIWDGVIGEPREAADAWRRVLRLKPADEEATQGLERAKSGMLRKAPGSTTAVTPAPAPSSSSSMRAVGPVPSSPSSSSMRAAVPAPTSSSSMRAVAPPPPPVPSSPAPAPSPHPAAGPTHASSLPEAASSAEDVSEDDLEIEEDVPHAVETRPTDPPQLESLLLGTTDPFEEADTTHTSIDVRLPLAAAKALKDGHPAPRPASSLSPSIPSSSLMMGPPSSRRSSKPPPLPPGYDTNEPPTSPGRRMDRPSGSALMPAPTSERALEKTGEDAPVDLLGRTSATEPSHSADVTGPSAIPLDVLSVTDLAAFDDEDEENDVLVVDEFVEGGDDEFEDVAEPSKPHGPIPH